MDSSRISVCIYIKRARNSENKHLLLKKALKQGNGGDF